MSGKVVIVTGAAQGIGLSIAKRFLAGGASVVLTDLNEKCVEVAKALAADGGDAVGIAANVADRADVNRLFDAVLARYGRVDVLVNNAGITSDARFHKMTEEQWDKVLNVNLKAMFHTCQRAVSAMLEQGDGAIVNIASISPQTGNFGQANYNASKLGVVGLTRTLSTEYAAKGIRTNAVAPGFILTDMVKTIPEKVVETIVSKVPMGRGGQPEEIANAVYFLASEEASFITGQVLSVNGGQYLG